MSKTEWNLNINEVASGPFSEEEIRLKFASQQIPIDTYVWKKGLKEWIPIQDSGILKAEVEHPPLNAKVSFLPTGYKAPTENSVIDYAGFWVRFSAIFIDGVLQILLGKGLEAAHVPGAWLLGAIFGGWYYIFFQAKHGYTIGKKILKLRVISQDLSPVSVKQMAIRYFSHILSSMILCLGYIWVGFDAKRRGWHDMIAKTYVIREDGSVLASQEPGKEEEFSMRKAG